MRGDHERFCPRCGAKGKRLINNLCEDCFWSERSRGVPREVKVTLCSSCFSYLQGKRWVRRRDPESAAFEGTIKEIQGESKLPTGTKISGIDCKTIERTAGGLPKKIALTITLSDSGTSRSFEGEAAMAYRLCDLCQESVYGRYEAIVQIRGEGGTLTENGRRSVESNIEQFCRRVSERDRPGITDIKDSEGGIDIKFLTSSKARLFARMLSESTGAEVKESSSIIGMDRRTGGRRTRSTISVRLPSLEVGDIVSFNNRALRIIGHHRGDLLAEDLEDHKKRILRRRSILGVKKIDSADIKTVSIASRGEGSITVLDLEEKRFYELPIERVAGDIKPGESGLLIKINGKERVYGLPK